MASNTWSADEKRTERLRQHARELREEGRAAARTTRSAVDEVAEAAREQLERNPYLTLGASFGVGWVLGHGLPLRVVTFAAGLAGRLALGAFLHELAQEPSVAEPPAPGGPGPEGSF